MSKTKCEHCGGEFERKDMEVVRVIDENGKFVKDAYLCEDCWSEESADCEECGRRCYPKDNLLKAPQYNDHTKTYKSYKFCGSCFDKKCIKCDKCGAILDRNHPEHDECYAVGNETWCLSCVEKHGWICDCCCEAFSNDDAEHPRFEYDGKSYCKECYDWKKKQDEEQGE